jgi:hypothetical protein
MEGAPRSKLIFILAATPNRELLIYMEGAPIIKLSTCMAGPRVEKQVVGLEAILVF